MNINYNIPGWMSDGELRIIARLATLIPENSLAVELGTFCGRSAWTWMHNMPQSVKLDLVDIWNIPMRDDLKEHIEIANGSPEAKALLLSLIAEFTEDGTGVFKAINEFLPHDERVTKYRCDVADYFPSRPPSLVFIDAQHTFDAVTADIRKYLPYEQCLLLGHDFAPYAPPVVSAVINNTGGRMLIAFRHSSLWMLVPTNGYWPSVIANIMHEFIT